MSCSPTSDKETAPCAICGMASAPCETLCPACKSRFAPYDPPTSEHHPAPMRRKWMG